MFFPLHLGPEPPPDDDMRHGRRPGEPDAPDDGMHEDPSGPGTVLHTITMIEKLQRRAFGIIFAEQGLHPAQGVCLKTISQYEGLSQRELADMLRIERATASVMLQKMEKSGIIERRPDSADQRISRIYLSEKGKLANRLTDDGCREFITDCISGLDEQQLEELKSSLKNIEDSTRKFISQHEKEG